MRHLLTRSATCCVLALVCLTAIARPAAAEDRHPNVVLIITDDQGYGDIGAHGNEMIRTPHLDRLHGESVRLTNFHVDPTCAPTRSSLMTGRYSTRTGVWHTIMGRSLMDTRELTLAEVFAANGYRTGMFGKWHLGDNYPLRPQDQGFETVVCHGGGGVTQTPDWWGNDYFDDIYLRNGRPEQFVGYCTDVWFREASRFITENAEEPFFCYLSTNAPHGPYLVDDSYRQPYLDAGVPEPMASFYGMITNIDENLGRLMALLDEKGLAKDTILIFMSDNGTAAGVARGRRQPDPDRWKGFNAGMRGQKGSEYDGGHRVPFFLRYPAGGLNDGRDVDTLTAHIDVLPTLVDLCGLKRPDGPAIDGQSVAGLITGEMKNLDRTLFVHSQRIEMPEKWRKCSVMTQRWRLVNGKELFDMQADPGQTSDVASAHPDVVTELRDGYEAWWKSLEPVFDEHVAIVLGSEHETPTHLTCHDWHTGTVPWNQGMVSKDPALNGYWVVEVPEAGRYRFQLRRRPGGVIAPLAAGEARIECGEAKAASSVEEGALFAELEVELDAGEQRLQTWLESADGTSRGAYFVDVTRSGE